MTGPGTTDWPHAHPSVQFLPQEYVDPRRWSRPSGGSASGGGGGDASATAADPSGKVHFSSEKDDASLYGTPKGRTKLSTDQRIPTIDFTLLAVFSALIFALLSL